VLAGKAEVGTASAEIRPAESSENVWTPTARRSLLAVWAVELVGGGFVVRARANRQSRDVESWVSESRRVGINLAVCSAPLIDEP